MNDAGPARLPAAARRAGIIEAADAEFAANGLAGTRLEAIAARAGISHPRIVQMFGSERKLFLEVVRPHRSGVRGRRAEAGRAGRRLCAAPAE
ncbi:helix-turn-helix domain-containing protein [Amycolatopsis sp. DG1A-15b]|uniref:helix-turn-helix domain-containing protein n=1 Tax=Amycolatopsis sp. DG1A-15b TaxID=3052846 RepID=UPI00255C0A54|nr:helix-turn-helix domain-containing protein [Amycolatopsis sp. DG1A-15b]WIX89846.1 helix-turn-helix domain-containing protein [Amycolatopsis sp. DG1A-15b]